MLEQADLDKVKKWLTPLLLTRDQEQAKSLREMHVRMKEAEQEMEQQILKELKGPVKEMASLEQTVKRLERQVDILQKELNVLKKDALTEVDIRPFKKLLK